MPASKRTTPQWNAFDATPQEESDGKVSMGPIWGLDCSQESCTKDVAVHAAAKATGLPVDALVESLFAGRRSPGELLHGRWDGKYDDGKTP